MVEEERDGMEAVRVVAAVKRAREILTVWRRPS
jgi:hypothetical protein